MLISSLLLIILYISHRYIVAWIIFYNNHRWTFW